MSATKTAREKGKGDFLINLSQLSSIADYSTEEKGMILQAISDFVFNDIKPGRGTAAEVAAGFFIQTIEENNRKWLEKCEENRQRARKRWEEEQGK